MNRTDIDFDLLAAAPLKQAIAQVRFERHPEVSQPDFISGFRAALGGDFSRIEQAASNQIILGPLGEMQKTGEGGWALRSDDGWTVTVLESSVTLEAASYTRWSGFTDRLETALAAMEQKIMPATEQRVGLRFVDEFRESTVNSPAEWKGKIRPELLGAVLLSDFAEYVAVAEQRLVLNFPDGEVCLIRHGALPSEPGTSAYVLDVDVSREMKGVYDAAKVREEFGSFHERAKTLFRRSITDEYFDELLTGEGK